MARVRLAHSRSPQPTADRTPIGHETPSSAEKRRPDQLEGMSVADNLVLQNLLELHEQLEVRLTAKMELHQTTLLEAVSGVVRQRKRGQAPSKEVAVERPSGAPRRPSCSSSPKLAPASEMSWQDERDDGNELVWSEASAVQEALPEAAAGGGATAQEAEHLHSPGMHKTLSNLRLQMTAHRLDIKQRLSSVGSEEPDQGWATRLVRCRMFETLVNVSILLNAVFVGWFSDWSIKNPGSTRPIVILVIDWMFIAICMLELALRMVAEGRKFFTYRSAMFGWNVFDASVIVLTLLNESDVIGVKLSVVRLFRAMRLVYVVRVIRTMQGFRELRIIVDGIMNCGKTLLWSSVIMAFMTYIYAVVCLQLSSEWLSEDASVSTEDTVRFLERYFPSLFYSIYTLFKAVAGGINWGELSDPLLNVSPVLFVSFPFYVMATVFCVLNIVTAAFVETASRMSGDDEASAMKHIEERTQWIKVISDIFQRHDADCGGTLDWHEFSSIVKDWRTCAAFEALGMDMSFRNAKILFDLFDVDGDGHIDINEFAQGMHHLKGNARSIDTYHQFLELSRQLTRLTRMVNPSASAQLGAHLGQGQSFLDR